MIYPQIPKPRALITGLFWCRTHGQCAAVTEYIAESLFPKVARDIMVDDGSC